MPASPAMAEQLAQTMTEMYAEAERQMIARLARALARDLDKPYWAEAKAGQLAAYRRQCEQLLEDLRARAQTGVETALTTAYEKGGMEAVSEIAKLKPGLPPVEPLGGVRAIEALVNETLGNITATHPGILRAALDGYRSIVAETAQNVLLGTQTRRQAAQAALDRWARAGLKPFKDAAGRAWNMQSYVEMAMRTGCGRAAVQGHVDRLVANGLDLVIVSDAPKECPLCRPWEGKVLSIGGTQVEMTEEVPKPFASDDEADAWAAQNFGSWQDALTQDQLTAFAYYSSSEYRSMNAALRAGKKFADKDHAKYARAMDDALDTVTLDRPVMAFRGMKADHIAAQWGDVDSLVGRVIEDKGYVSTSVSKLIGDKFVMYAEDAKSKAAVIRISVPKGTHAAYLERISDALPEDPDAYSLLQMGERELLLPRGSKFRIVKVEKGPKGRLTIDMELVP